MRPSGVCMFAMEAPPVTVETVEVDLGDRTYPIYIGRGLLDEGELLRRHVPGKRALIVTNTTVGPLYLERRVTPATCWLSLCKPVLQTRYGEVTSQRAPRKLQRMKHSGSTVPATCARAYMRVCTVVPLHRILGVRWKYTQEASRSWCSNISFCTWQSTIVAI